MIYSNFQEKSLSLLGMGGMRFPCDADGQVDIPQTAEMIDLCIKNGVNYFDTAWFYHDGKSEEILGGILKNYPRDSYNLATKLPGHDFKSLDEVKTLFETQLARTGAGYFDFYLLHNVCKSNIATFTSKELGIIDYLLEQKKNGRIRHFGFSTHGTIPLVEEFIREYRDIMEFCQIQLNWLDWTLQDAKEKVAMLNRYKMPIWVMEPVRGGALARLSKEHEDVLTSLRPDEKIPAWSFRFLQGIEGIQMILSGMSSKTQVMENLQTFQEYKPLTDEEQQTVLQIADKILAKKSQAETCTRCRYCVDNCPAGLEIPVLLDQYNQMCLVSSNVSVENLEKVVERDKFPTACVGCKTCEEKCPQNIRISEIMAAFSEELQR